MIVMITRTSAYQTERTVTDVTTQFTQIKNKLAQTSQVKEDSLIKLRNLTVTGDIRSRPKFAGPYRMLHHIGEHRYKRRHLHTSHVREEHADNLRLLKSEEDENLI